MAFDKLFCPIIKSNKSSRKSTTSLNQQTSQKDLVPRPDGVRHESGSSTNAIMWKCVKEAYKAEEQDELTVERGDVVALIEGGENWSYVMGFKGPPGYVPSYLLKEHSIRPKVRSVRDTRTTIDLHQHSRPHSHKTHCTSERTCHSIGCSIKPELVTNSAQGSSGCQTFQNYPFSPYPNECMAAPIDCNTNYTPFLTLDPPPAAFMSHNFTARQEGDLDVRPQSRVFILNDSDPDWFWVRRQDGKEGFVPSSFMFHADSRMLHKANSTATMKSSNQNDFHTYINQPAERKSLTTDQQSTANF